MKGSLRIAFAGVSAALSVVCLILSIFVPPVQFTFLIISSVALMLPLAKKDFICALLAYLSASAVSLFMIGGYLDKIILYWIFFGTHPILLAFLNHIFKKIKKPIFYILTYTIKIVYAYICITVLYFAMVALGVSINIFDIQTWALFLLVLPVFVVYDIIMTYMQRSVDFLAEKHLFKTASSKPTFDDDIFGLGNNSVTIDENTNSILNDDELDK